MQPDSQSSDDVKTVEQVYRPVTRRTFLKGSAAAMVATAGLMAALKPLLALERGEITLDGLLQKHYRELKPEEMQTILRNLEEKCRQEYGAKPDIRDIKALDGVQFAYALNLTRCVGCRKCAHACLKENNQSRDDDRDIEMSYIRVLEMQKGAINLETSDVYYDPAQVPQKDKYYMPVQCHQCRESPCTKVCPVQATWQEKDGIVVVDYNWCIGCRYCQAACPYHARRFNWVAPSIEPDRVNPNQGYLSNRIRPVGVVEKCTFCLHRTRAGRYPACYEVCPTGARKFGNLADPASEVRKIVENKRVWILKEELGTEPRFFYFYG